VNVGPRWLPPWPIEFVGDLIAGRPHCLACRDRDAKDFLRALSRERHRIGPEPPAVMDFP
jgi:hypothetical protein